MIWIILVAVVFVGGGTRLVAKSMQMRLAVLALVALSLLLLIPGLWLPVLTIRGVLTPEGVALMALHEPGGQPFRDVPLTVAGHEEGAGRVDIDARDVRPGHYEVVVVSPPAARTPRGPAAP